MKTRFSKKVLSLVVVFVMTLSIFGVRVSAYADVNNAKALAKKLKANDQVALNKRIIGVQEIINASIAVVNAEKYKTQSYFTKAQNAIKVLPVSTIKTKLQTKLNVIKKKQLKF